MGIINRDKKSSSSSSSSTSPCALLRSAYHNCFNRWYSEKFVKGHWDKEECVSQWKEYRACLSEHLQDSQFCQFLEADVAVDQMKQPDSASSFGAGATGVH